MLEKEEQGYILQEIEKNNEQLTKQLKELASQLNYKDIYENEWKKRIKVEDQLREAEVKLKQCMQDMDTIK